MWEGKPYEDKGTILRVEPEKLLESTYWSAMSGLADVPENYNKVAYGLRPLNGGTEVTVSQDTISSEESKTHMEENWGMVLNSLKQLLEK